MVREFENKDLSAVMELWLNANLDAHSFVPAEYWKNNLEAVKEMIPEAQVYVCEEDGEIVGFIGMMGNYIAGIFVDRSKRSKGMGTQLLNAAKAQKNRLTLSVYEKNKAAVRFYERAGFRIEKQGVDDDTKENEYMMSWQR